MATAAEAAGKDEDRDGVEDPAPFLARHRAAGVHQHLGSLGTARLPDWAVAQHGPAATRVVRRSACTADTLQPREAAGKACFDAQTN